MGRYGYFLATCKALYGKAQSFSGLIKMTDGRLITLLTALYCLAMAAPAARAEMRHTSEYSISLGILPIARASFSTEMNGRVYSISGSFRSAGVANIVADISGKTSVSGMVQGNRLQARNYSLVYRNGKRTRTYEVGWRNSNVVSSTIEPQPRRPESWIAVEDRDLRSVLDPLSGMIFPARAKVCPSRLPVYDGESRMDLVLTASGTKPFSTNGFSGEAIVCNLKYVPKSGYRKGRSDIEYLRSISMEVWFARAENMDLYAPVYARIPTRAGPLYVTATKYGG